MRPTPSAKPTASPSAKPTTKPGQVDVYSTPGVHFVGGRQWWTECEKYSQTTRCTTRIYATQVSQVNGRFVQTNDWVFNNLTYLPQMTRQQWKGNPLGATGSWTDASGRAWRTECDTAVTGRNGCRTYAEADVIAAVTVNGVRGYRWETRMVLNNIVRFR